MKCFPHFAATVVLALCGSNTSAAQPITVLNAASAQKIIEGCVKHSAAKKQSHAIAVVDNSGALLAFVRMDGNPPGVGEFALQKAVAAAAWRFSTEQMSEAAQRNPGFSSAPKVVTVPGGVPIYAQRGGDLLGAIGVSGEAPQDDAACAIAGITAAGFSQARTR